MFGSFLDGIPGWEGTAGADLAAFAEDADLPQEDEPARGLGPSCLRALPPPEDARLALIARRTPGGAPWDCYPFTTLPPSALTAAWHRSDGPMRSSGQDPDITGLAGRLAQDALETLDIQDTLTVALIWSWSIRPPCAMTLRLGTATWQFGADDLVPTFTIEHLPATPGQPPWRLTATVPAPGWSRSCPDLIAALAAIDAAGHPPDVPPIDRPRQGLALPERLRAMLRRFVLERPGLLAQLRACLNRPDRWARQLSPARCRRLFEADGRLSLRGRQWLTGGGRPPSIADLLRLDSQRAHAGGLRLRCLFAEGLDIEITDVLYGPVGLTPEGRRFVGRWCPPALCDHGFPRTRAAASLLAELPALLRAEGSTAGIASRYGLSDRQTDFLGGLSARRVLGGAGVTGRSPPGSPGSAPT
ncbi:hypothetical protein [Mitsuaria sp. GD03876]|uniref:hypothetical protein n=1 Tax=Mitsuaria sp. GD03876 TaxID=2975399 RepID=UPI00244BB5FD|nr:hypothetical protein [Mitsuaria sp. GD03876]MDH0867834.1 hypothetical protein [Mitsuaria sp. GD03876]